MTDTSIKTSELSSRNILISPNTQFLILDKGVTIQSPQGSTMTTPASAVLALVAGAYNLNNLNNLFTGFASQSANNLSSYTTVNTNSAIDWNYQGTDVKALTANWQNTYTNFSVQSANNLSNYTTVNTNSATWNAGGGGSGTDTAVRALTGNWQNTFTTVNTNSATWNAGGSALIRAAAALQAYTVAGVPEGPPPDLILTWDMNSDNEFIFTLNYNGTVQIFTASSTDPADGTTWLDSTSWLYAQDPANALRAAINIIGGHISAGGTDAVVEIHNDLVGVSAALGCSYSGISHMTSSGGGFGNAATTNSGGTQEVTLVGAVSGKSIKCIQLIIDGNVSSTEVAFYFKSGAVYTLLTAPKYGNSAAVCSHASDSGYAWLHGLNNQALIVRFTPETIGSLPTDSSFCWCGAIVEQY